MLGSYRCWGGFAGLACNGRVVRVVLCRSWAGSSRVLFTLKAPLNGMTGRTACSGD